MLNHLKCVYYSRSCGLSFRYTIGNLTKQIVFANRNQKAIEIQKGSNSKTLFRYITYYMSEKIDVKIVF